MSTPGAPTATASDRRVRELQRALSEVLASFVESDRQFARSTWVPVKTVEHWQEVLHGGDT